MTKTIKLLKYNSYIQFTQFNSFSLTWCTKITTTKNEVNIIKNYIDI